MLRVARGCRRTSVILSPLRTNTTKAPQGISSQVSEKKKGSGFFTWFIAGNLAAMGYMAFRCEEDETFARTVDSVSPIATQALSPFRNIVKSLDLVKIVSPLNKLDSSAKPTKKDAVATAQEIHIAKVSEEPTPAAAAPAAEKTHMDDSKTEVAPEAAQQRADTSALEQDEPQGTPTEEPAVAHESVDAYADEEVSMSPAPDAKGQGEPTDTSPEAQNVSTTETAVVHTNVHVPEDCKLHQYPVVEGAESHSRKNIVQAMRADASRLAVDMKRDLEISLLRNGHLDEDSVNKILLMASEQFERISYEIIVLQQSLHAVEGEVDAKYRDLMRAQHTALEEELRQKLHSQEQVHLSATADKLKDMNEKFAVRLEAAILEKTVELESRIATERAEEREQVRADLQEQMFENIQRLEQMNNSHLLDMQSKIEEVGQRVVAFNNVLDQNEGVIKKTMAVHTISGALLALEMALNDATRGRGDEQKIAQSVKSLRTLCGDDDLVMGVLDSLPGRVLKSGAPTLSELQVRFAVMRDEVRKTALAPENAPQLVGQIVGTIMATISSAPKGYVAGDGVEERLARSAYELERGRVKQAVKEIEGVEGYTAVLMGDWKQLAEDSLLVEQSLRALKARAVALHRSFS